MAVVKIGGPVPARRRRQSSGGSFHAAITSDMPGTSALAMELPAAYFLQAGTLGAIGLSLPQLLAMQQARAAATKPDDRRSVIMIFNLGCPEPARYVGHEARAPAEIRGPFKPIGPPRPGFEIRDLPQHAKFADKFSLVRSCYHTAAAVHDTGHQMIQTGRLFTGGINTPHAGCVGELSPRAAERSARHVMLPELMGRPAETCPTGRTPAFWERHTIRSSRCRPVAAEFRVPDLLPPQKSARFASTAAESCGHRRSDGRSDSRASENDQLLDSNFEAAFRLMTSPQAARLSNCREEPEAVAIAMA